MACIIDTSAWIEYLEGSAKGEKIHEILKGKEEIFILPIIIAEVISKTKKKKGNIEIAYNALISNTKTFEITPRIAKESGILHAQTKAKLQSFALADALIICAARFLKAKIITLDYHFKLFKEAIIL